jgi:hypothetical protein
MDVSQSNANTAYLALAGLVSGIKVYRTTDGGSSWQNISYNLPNVPVNCIKTIPVTGELIAATDLGIYKFDEAANNWINKSSGLPNVIVSDIEFNQVLNKMYAATFGRGIWETDLSFMTGTNDKLKDEIGLELFPSPNSGSFEINLLQKAFVNESLTLQIVDVMGREVFTKVLAGEKKYKFSIDVPSGLYFAKLKGANFNAVKSFVVTRE